MSRMNSGDTDTRPVEQGHTKVARTVFLVFGLVTLLLAWLSPEFRVQLVLTGISLLLVGWFVVSLLRSYRNIAVVLLNSVLLFLFLEFASTAILATAKSPYIRGVLESIMGRPHQIVDHYLALPYYSEQDWSTAYWQEHLRALKKDYYPYVIWRSPSYRGELLNVDQQGIRKTPGVNCSPDSFRVYVFGGSSVWGWGSPDWGTIPAYLQDRLSAVRKGSICVVNYGENAYVSTQNLIQLITLLERNDVADLVIFYDGVNDVLAAKQNGEPVVHQNFSRIAALFEEPGHPLIKWLRGLNTIELFHIVFKQFGLFGTAKQGHAEVGYGRLADAVVQCYLNNYRMVAALAQAYGFEYYFFLQPYILAGEKPLTAEEKNMITGLNWVFDLNPAFISLFDTIYGQIDFLASQHEHLVSLTGVFDNVEEQIWLDSWGHITPTGNEKVAEAIMQVVTAR